MLEKSASPLMWASGLLIAVAGTVRADETVDCFVALMANHQALTKFDVLIRISDVEPKPDIFVDSVRRIRIVFDSQLQKVACIESAIKQQSGDDRPSVREKQEGGVIAHEESVWRINNQAGLNKVPKEIQRTGIPDMRAIGLTGELDTVLTGFEFNSKIFDRVKTFAAVSTPELTTNDRLRFLMDFGMKSVGNGTSVGHVARYTFDRMRYLPVEYSVTRHVSSSERPDQKLQLLDTSYTWTEDPTGIYLPETQLSSRRRVAYDESNQPLGIYHHEQEIEFFWLGVNKDIDERLLSLDYWRDNPTAIDDALSHKFLRTE